MTISHNSNLSNNQKLYSQAQRDKIMENKQQPTDQETVSKAAIQTLETPEIDSPQETKTSESLIKRFANWWETTTVERYLEDVADLLKESAILDILGLVANFTLILSLFGWWVGREEQQENKLFATWTIINDAEADQSGVVKTALERLHKETFSLQGLELEETNLKNINLKGANLEYVNLKNAFLYNADLQGANLYNANLVGTNLLNANLRGANLTVAIFEDDSIIKNGIATSKASINGANLKGAFLINTEDRIKDSQIKSACFWEQAIYKGNWDEKAEKWIVDKEANQKYIEQLKQHQSSDPKQQPDCSKW